jgi:membrane-bound serine protease (ClpP class)
MARLLRFLSHRALHVSLAVGMPAPAGASLVRVLTEQGPQPGQRRLPAALRGRVKAIGDKADLVVIEMDTPGDLMNLMMRGNKPGE